MSYFNDINVVEIQKGAFSVLLTATILTIFEILFFYWNVVPSVKYQVSQQLSNIGKFNDVLYNNYKEKFKRLEMKDKTALTYVIDNIQSKTDIDVDIEVVELLLISSFDNEQIRKIFSSSKEELEVYIDNFIKDNLYTNVLEILYLREDILVKKINNYVGWTSLLIILVLLFTTYFCHGILRENIYPKENFSTEMKEVYYSSALTLVFLIAFQILFYNYGLSYKYVGTNGNEEFVEFILTNINQISS